MLIKYKNTIINIDKLIAIAPFYGLQDDGVEYAAVEIITEKAESIFIDCETGQKPDTIINEIWRVIRGEPNMQLQQLIGQNLCTIN